ncbi:MAG: hypothetical protein PUA83_05580 [Clostridiales bacterium]|nr:hypothetical protein [Clostridiales bacterium]
MTYGELFDEALGILEYDGREGREAFGPPIINSVLAELFEINNRLRALAGKAPLSEIPRCADFDSDIPYEEEIQRRDMVLGTVCRLAADEEDASLHNFYSAEYELAKRNHRDRDEFAIEDFYR